MPHERVQASNCPCVAVVEIVDEVHQFLVRRDVRATDAVDPPLHRLGVTDGHETGRQKRDRHALWGPVVVAVRIYTARNHPTTFVITDLAAVLTRKSFEPGHIEPATGQDHAAGAV